MGLLRPILRRVILGISGLLYEVQVLGREHVPGRGGALLAGNHQSFLDAALVLAHLDRNVRFLISHEMMQVGWIRPLARFTRAIPLVRTLSPRALLEALHEAHATVARGELAGIFPEGQVTRIGHVLPFRRGYERVVRHLDVPIVPFAVEGAYETALSLRPRRQLLRAPFFRRRKRVTIQFGEPLPADTPPEALREAVVALQARAWLLRSKDEQPLHVAALERLRWRPREQCFLDGIGGQPASNRRVAAEILALAREIDALAPGEGAVGILLPPSGDAAVLNIAVLLSGRAAVNMDPNDAPEDLARKAEMAKARTVIGTAETTTRLAPQTGGLRTATLEEIGGRRTHPSLRREMVEVMTTSPRRLAKQFRSAENLDAPAAVVFTRGRRSGAPRAVTLSHWAIVSNCRAVLTCMPPQAHARSLSVLPFAHAWGLMTGLWIPLLAGHGLAYAEGSSLSGAGELATRGRITQLAATPELLRQWCETVEPGDFGSLRFVASSLEVLGPELRRRFEQRFGVGVYDALTVTEAGPLVAFNVPDLREPGTYQKGAKAGSVGLVLPSLLARCDGGEVVVLRCENSGPIEHRTGDRGAFDEEGFLFLGGDKTEPH